MSFKSAVFASARVKSRESKMLSQERLSRMTEATTAEDVLKILYESSYAEGVMISDAKEYQKMLDSELNNLITFFKEVCPDKNVLRCFLLNYDYNNAKAIIKAKYSKTKEYDFMTYENALIDIKQLVEYIYNDNYTFLPPYMAKALSNIDISYASYGKNPALWDNELNKAYYNDIKQQAEKCNDKIKNYFQLKADIENLLTVIKCKALNLEVKDFDKQFVGGGQLGSKVFEQTLGSSYDSAAEFFKHTNLSELAQKGFKSLESDGITLIEKEADDILNSYFSKFTNELDTVYPLLDYYLKKIAEIKNIKLIFTAISGGAEKAEIKKRLRAI